MRTPCSAPALCVSAPVQGQPSPPQGAPSSFQAADKASRKRYEPSDKDRQSPPPAKRANVSPDRGEPRLRNSSPLQGLQATGTRTPFVPRKY